jgi:hypothetical protein
MFCDTVARICEIVGVPLQRTARTNMKKRTMLVLAASLLGVYSVEAKARQLPREYLGQWCIDIYGSNQDGWVRYTKDSESCGDGLLIIKRRSYRPHEEYCRITSIGKTVAISDGWQPPNRSWVANYPIIPVVIARCTYEDQCMTWTEKTELDYDYRRDLLYIKRLRQSDDNPAPNSRSRRVCQ